MEILVVVGGADDAGVEFFNRKTIYGKAVVATFNDRDGQADGHQHRLGDHLFVCTVVGHGGFAGVDRPLTLTGATMGSVLGLKAFAVAIIGGLTSGMGIIVGGIILSG
jgi:branched-chain amino acid transport system permease protein